MIQIAIMGFGTVGTGVAKVVAENAKQIERKLGEPLQVKAILVRHFKDGPYRQLMTDDFRKIEEDDDIRVVVETIGGVEAAYEYTKRALMAGKHVVTANKQLVAEHGCELLELAKKKNVNYLFEASVGGGIPILHPLTQCMAANRIDEVYGILNGTTNYILTRMVRTGAFFSDALREAQAKGYAEADPTADVEGIDAGRKTCILADLAFGHQVDPASVPMEGITKLSLRDVKIAQRAGYRIKLLGRAVRLPGGGRTGYVAPHLIPEDNPIANVEDVFNAVMVRGNATGDVMFYGRGAGWQRQLHIYECPFYYIDYCLAQTVALQFFAAHLADPKDAWQRYLALVRQAGTASYPQLVKAAGLAVPFEDGSLAPVAHTVAQWIVEHQV